MHPTTPDATTNHAHSTDPAVHHPANGLNPLHVNFAELYGRHLCRHGQFGINLWHLLAVLGIYFSVISLVNAAVRRLSPHLDAQWQIIVLTLLSAPWLAIILRNTPALTWLFTAICTLLLMAAAVLSPPMPFWIHLLLIPAWHRLQLWSHRRYTLHRDMTAFDSKYRRGKPLVVLLAVYELPLLLHYLILGRRDWTA